MKKCISPNDAYKIRSSLKGRNIVMVGMMGSGKSAIGKRLAGNLDLPFIDADKEIELAAGMSITHIFDAYGESHFRRGEQKVIARLMNRGPIVLSTGGGAFMQQETRALILERAISVWLKAELNILLQRVNRKNTRPLLKQGKTEEVMRTLLKQREPIYQLASITVESRDEPHETVVKTVATRLLQATMPTQEQYG